MRAPKGVRPWGAEHTIPTASPAHESPCLAMPAETPSVDREPYPGRRIVVLGVLAVMILVPVTLPVTVLRGLIQERFGVGEFLASLFMSINMVGAVVVRIIAFPKGVLDRPRSTRVPNSHLLAKRALCPNGMYRVITSNSSPPRPSSAPGIGVTIDLNKLESLTGNDAVIFERFLRSIQMQRQDFNGRVLSIRRDDLRMLAALLDQTEERFSDRLADLGVSDEA